MFGVPLKESRLTSTDAGAIFDAVMAPGAILSAVMAESATESAA